MEKSRRKVRTMNKKAEVGRTMKKKLMKLAEKMILMESLRKRKNFLLHWMMIRLES